MTDLGGLTARVGLNTTGLRTGRVVAQEELLKVEGSMLRAEKASTRLGMALGSTGKLAGALIGFELLRKGAEGIKGSIEYAVELESTMRRVKSVFGDSSEQLVKFSDTADQALGRTKASALSTAVRFGTLGTQFGETTSQAAKTSIALTKLATDLAASKGTPVDQAEGALATALVGRGRALRLYGVDVSAARVKEEAFREGLISSTKDALTPAIQYQAAYNLIMAETVRVQGYFAKNTDTTAEKVQQAKATLKDASEELGLAFAPAAKKAAQILSDDVAPALKTAGEGIKYLADHPLARDLTEAAVGVGGAVYVIAKGADLLKSATEGLSKIRSALGHTENSVAIEAEGRAATVTAGQLDILALAEQRASAAALLAADSEAVLAAASRAAGTTAVTGGGVPAVAPAAGGKPGLPSILGGGVGLVLVGGIVYGVSQVQAENARMDALKKQVAAGKSLSPAERQKQAADLGVSPGSKPGQYITDPKRDRNDITAGIRLLDETGQTSNRPAQLRLGRVQIAAGNLEESQRALFQAEKQAADPNVRSANAGLIGGVLGGAFDTLPTTSTGNADAVAAANLRVQSAQARVDRLSAGGGKASQSSILSAQAAVLSAEDTLRKHKGDTTAQTLRLQAAEERLATLRSGGKVNTSALAIAEGQLALARKKADEAAGKNGTTALGTKDVFGRIGGQLGRTKALKDDARTLIRDGVSGPLLVELENLEKTAPGTLHKLATTMTKAQGSALTSQYSQLQAQWSAFLGTPQEAAVNAGKLDARRKAASYARAVRQAYASALSDDGLPVPGSGTVGSGPSARGAVPHGSSKTTNYHIAQQTIVANDPTEMARQLENRARRNALFGMS
jgi:hypothetical protein